ncbi:MAG: LPS export ABC transporter periplasmic protein LptC [Spirochaetaceae bacterium]|jgi:LPS export ABC transporter protein LptC|nr:LPS export ABC transporter periplasmic protein LptC [Spirochaetaceae bacterium]
MTDSPALPSIFVTFFLIAFFAACSFDYGSDAEDNNDPSMILTKTSYVRMRNGNPEARLGAEEVRQYEANHSWELDDVSFEQFNAAPEGYDGIPDLNARGTAATARLETDTGNFSLSGGVVLEVISEGIVMETTEVFWQDQDRLLSAPEQLNIVRDDGTTLTGRGFSADIRRRTFVFESAAEGVVVDEEDEADG